MDLRYPIGPFVPPQRLTTDERHERIEQLATLPASFRAAVEDLTDDQLDTPYRPGGWTVRQLAHHVPDSHLNAYLRIKLALTESEPTIRPYDQARWAELPDSRAPVAASLDLLDALHRRWHDVLKTLRPEDFDRRLIHPESGVMSIDQVVALYAWHGRHHLAHVTTLRDRMGW